MPAFEATSKKFAASVAAPKAIEVSVSGLAIGLPVLLVSVVWLLNITGVRVASEDRIRAFSEDKVSVSYERNLSAPSFAATQNATSPSQVLSDRSNGSAFTRSTATLRQGDSGVDDEVRRDGVKRELDEPSGAPPSEQTIERIIREATPRISDIPALTSSIMRQIEFVSPFEIGERRSLQLAILASHASGRENPDGRFMLTWELASGLFVGVAAGVGYENNSVIRFSGFQDTMFQHSDGDMSSRIGQFKTIEEPRAIYHGGLVVAYRPASISIGPLQPGLTAIFGYEGDRLMCEPSISLNLALNERWGLACAIGSRLYPLVEHPIGITPSVGVTANF